MFSAGLLHWLTSDQGLMQTMAQNWLVGVLIVSAIIFLETGLVLLIDWTLRAKSFKNAI